MLAGAENKKGAEALIEFLGSDAFQATVAANMYVYPIADVAVPETWAKFAPPARSSLGSNLDFANNRTSWLKDWQSVQGD